MKRLLLLIVLIWSLTGCGDAQEEASSDDSPETTEKATLEETSEKTSGETTEEVTEETVVVEEPIAAEEPVVVEAPPEAPSVPDPSPPQSAVSGTAEDCIPSCQGAAIRRGEVPLTAQEEANLRAQGILDPGVEAPQAPTPQSTDPNGPYYRPPSGPCLGQCTDAQGRNNAEIQTEALRERGLLP